MLSERGRKRECVSGRQSPCELGASSSGQNWLRGSLQRQMGDHCRQRANGQCSKPHFYTVNFTLSPSLFLCFLTPSLSTYLLSFFFPIKAQDLKSCLEWAWLYDQREESFSTFPFDEAEDIIIYFSVKMQDFFLADSVNNEKFSGY